MPWTVCISPDYIFQSHVKWRSVVHFWKPNLGLLLFGQFFFTFNQNMFHIWAKILSNRKSLGLKNAYCMCRRYPWYLIYMSPIHMIPAIEMYFESSCYRNVLWTTGWVLYRRQDVQQKYLNCFPWVFGLKTFVIGSDLSAMLENFTVTFYLLQFLSNVG